MADALDLGSSVRKSVGVQVPPAPPINNICSYGEMADAHRLERCARMGVGVQVPLRAPNR